MWFGGESLTPWMVRRTVRYGKGAWPLKPMSPEEMDILRHAMAAAGRDMDELELGALIFGRPFKGSDDLLDLDKALEPVTDLYASGGHDVPAQAFGVHRRCRPARRLLSHRSGQGRRPHVLKRDWAASRGSDSAEPI